MGLHMLLEGVLPLGYYRSPKGLSEDMELALQDHVPAELAETLTYLTFELAYWRNAYCVHQWFVDEFVDESESRILVDKENLQQLLHRCREVVSYPEQAEEILPPPLGLFISSEDVVAEAEGAVPLLEQILSYQVNLDIYYTYEW